MLTLQAYRQLIYKEFRLYIHSYVIARLNRHSVIIMVFFVVYSIIFKFMYLSQNILPPVTVTDVGRNEKRYFGGYIDI